MIRKSGNRFSSKIMRHLGKLERNRFNLKRLPAGREQAWRICARPGLASVLLASALLCGAASVALAAEGQVSGASAAIFFAQVGVLLLVGRALGELMQRFGQPEVMGQLLGGLLLGPSLLGLISPHLQHALFPPTAEQKGMLDAVSQLGILLLLLLTGMETDLRLVRRVGRSAMAVAAAGVALPFMCGFALGALLPDSLLPHAQSRFVTALFLATALSISSIKIVAVVVREMNFMRRDIGQIIVASAILEDTAGWVIIAISFGLASSGTMDLRSVSFAVLGTLAFLAVSLTIGRRVVSDLIRWANDHFASDFPVITMILLITIAMALTTYLIGVHTVLGAFVAGVLIGESPILTRHIEEQLRGLIAALFMPVFFGLSGLSADLTILKDPELLLLAIGLIVIASAGKFAGAFVGGKLGRLTGRESLALASAMNARGSTEVIVASIALSAGVFSKNLFTLIVAMAMITTMAMPPMLRWALRRLPLRHAERLRLEREELDARGFVPNLERLLLVVDGSAHGKFASRLAGVIAGSGDKPTTIIELAPQRRPAETVRLDEEQAKEQVRSAAAGTVTLAADPDEETRGSVDVTMRTRRAASPEAVADEAQKGYDLLIVGMEKTRTVRGGFSREITRVVGGFDGPLAVAIAGGPVATGNEPIGRILIPVNGTDVSRRAAETGFALARSTGSRVSALYVATGRSNGAGRGRIRRGVDTRRNEEAVLKDIAELADRYDARVRTALRVDAAVEEAILREAKRGSYDLVVLGVTRRPGDTLFFGNMAAALLERCDTAILFVAS
jgi:Kef-type K+ transport system membrane component KefB/nucleotide-binding universal stress UspA family protein